MANLRIIHTNIIDTAINLASTPACVTTMPVENIQQPKRAKYARVVSTTTWSITGETASDVSGMVIVGHNLTGGATVRLRLYSDFAKTTMIYDSTALAVGTPLVWGDPESYPNGGLSWGVQPWLSNGLLSGTPEYLSLWFTKVTNVAAFVIDIVDTYNSDGFLQLGRVYLGEYWSPAINADYGLSMSWKEASKQNRTDGGSLHTEGYYPYRIYTANFGAMDETDRSAFMDIIRKVGMRLDILVSFYPSEGGKLERDYTAAVKFTTLPKMTSASFTRFESSAEFEEV